MKKNLAILAIASGVFLNSSYGMENEENFPTETNNIKHLEDKKQKLWEKYQESKESNDDILTEWAKTDIQIEELKKEEETYLKSIQDEEYRKNVNNEKGIFFKEKEETYLEFMKRKHGETEQENPIGEGTFCETGNKKLTETTKLYDEIHHFSKKEEATNKKYWKNLVEGTQLETKEGRTEFFLNTLSNPDKTKDLIQSALKAFSNNGEKK